MGGGSENTTTTVQEADPWKPARPALTDALNAGRDLFAEGGFAADPYQGQRVAQPGGATSLAQQMVMDQAQGPSASQGAQGYLQRMMSEGFQNDQLQAAQDNALGAAIPAAMSQFAGSGMANSTSAMDTVGRAATQATAPYAYDAMNQMTTNALRGAALAPQVDQASYMPSQMMGLVGQQQDALSQANIDADMQAYYEGENQDANNLGGFANLAALMSGQGGQSSTTQPGPSGAQKIGGAALGGLGTYGALAGMGIGGPLAIGGGALAGLMGLL